jgi:hypothetical protein
LKIPNKKKRASKVAQVVQHLPRKHKTKFKLQYHPPTKKKKKKKEKKEKRKRKLDLKDEHLPMAHRLPWSSRCRPRSFGIATLEIVLVLNLNLGSRLKDKSKGFKRKKELGA